MARITVEVSDEVAAQHQADHFWSQVDMNGECWCWTGQFNTWGYGYYSRKILGRRTTQLAHRLAWELTNGPIPDGLVIDHVCHNRGCVRPSHIRLVTPAQNGQNIGVSKRNKTGVRGVTWVGYRASVSCNGIREFKNFDTLDEAEAWVISRRNEVMTHNDEDRTS